MLFPTFAFAVFFCVVLTGHRLLARAGTAARLGWLLGASLLFYFLWLPPYLLLLLATMGINYAFLVAMERSTRPKAWLAASIILTLGLLGSFKYLDFLAGLAAPFVQILSGFEVRLPRLLLPLGISFYSFQIIALHVDVYRGELERPRSLARYALFLCFFPQLIAGPILRGREFLPQLAQGGVVSPERSRRGLWLIAVGLVKKVLLGDFLLAPIVGPAFGSPGVLSGPEHLMAVYAFAFQIYFDFSGYTDMARGVANLLGFHLPLNFEEPYLSRNPTEFWRRWHMTLSRWLRDYLYIPLGGNRQGSARTGVNLFLTMLLGGLWHGAGWNFVLWGGLHGVLLAIHRPMRARNRAEDPITWRDAGRIFLCFHAVVFLWIFFRARDFSVAMEVIYSIFFGSWNIGLPPWSAAVVAFAGGLHVLERLCRPRFDRLRASFESVPGAVVEGLVFGGLLALVVAASGAGGQFIYFQF